MKLLLLRLAASVLVLLAPCAATGVVINPSDDATVNVFPGGNSVFNGAYVQLDRFQQGVIKFSTAQITGPVGSAFLTINPYGLPLNNLSVDVYGFLADNGTIIVSDANAGVYLGSIAIPADTTFGQDLSFDVTSFISGATGPFVGFSLRNTGGIDIFSSIEFNYGHPSQLQVTVIPEPGVGLEWRLVKRCGRLCAGVFRGGQARAFGSAGES